MNLNESDITGVILAGGQSLRMGYNKAEAEVHGKSMLIRMIDKMEMVTSSIMISNGSITYSNITWPQIPDEHPHCGPIGGIYSILKRSESQLNLVVSCDIPLVSVSLLNYMVDSATVNDSLITVPVDHEGQLHMTCAVYHKDLLPIVKQQIDARRFKMKNLLDLVSVEYINISREHPLFQENAFLNVNRPNTLEEARKLWSNQKK